VKRFSIAAVPFEIAPLRTALHQDPRAGAFAAFEGLVRQHNEGRPVCGLRYEAYVELAEREGGEIMQEALARFSILDARCVHRIGDLDIGDLAVWVGVTSAHRGPAFEACRYIIDEVKARVPIWKYETYADGDSGWLHPDAEVLPVQDNGGVRT